MKILFMGTPQFALNSLKRLIEDKHNITAVVTQPDKPKGRGLKLTPPAVKTLALERDIPVYQPEKINNDEIKEILNSHKPELIVVVAYGKILPEYVLNFPKHGCINVHASLLPKYRGAAPINWAIINGENETGITTMYMEKGLDTGDMILKHAVKIEDNDTASTLHDKLSVLGAELLSKTVALLQNGKVQRIRQNDDEATYAPLLDKVVTRIDFNNNSTEIINKVRGLNSHPGAYTTLNGKILKIYRCEKTEFDFSKYENGQIISADSENGIIVKCSDAAIRLNEILMQGSKRMSSADYLKGHKINILQKLV